MALFDKVLKALDYIPIWNRKRLVTEEPPCDINALKKRFEESILISLNAFKDNVEKEIIPSELEAFRKRIREEIAAQLDAFKKSIDEEIVSELDALKRRIGELEQKLGEKWPPEICRHCGERGLRLAHAIPVPDSQGYMREDWRCEKCGKYDVRAYKPAVR